MYGKSNRSARQENDRPARVVQTLAGPVLYKDSDWAPVEWDLITAAMARCTGVADEGPRRGKRKPKGMPAKVKVSYRCPICSGSHPRKECRTTGLF